MQMCGEWGCESYVYPYKQILIVYIILRYVWEQYVNFRQMKTTLVTELPAHLRQLGISYDQFLLGQAYAMDKMAFKMLSLSIKTCLWCLKIVGNVLPFIWENVDDIFPFIDMESEFQRALGYTLIEMFIAKAFMVPLEAYQMEIIDKKHKMVTKTLYDYSYDLFVEGILTLLVISPIIYGYLRLVTLGGKYYFLFLQVFILALTIILAQLYPNIITPYFSRFKSIKSAQLKFKIGNLAAKTGFPLGQIKIKVDGKYDQHGAEYHGLGRKKVIVIYDTLLQNLTSDEIMGVLCHQVGHWWHNHTFKTLLFHLIENISLFYIYSFFVNNESIFRSFGFKNKSVFVGTALFFELFVPLRAIFQNLRLVMNRFFEFQSDNYAVSIGYGRQLKDSLIKLYRDSASRMKPDVIYAWVNFTHPTLHQRIENIDRLLTQQYIQRQKWLHED